jgi:hypothetical protein
MSLLLLLAPSPVHSGYALSHVPMESHHGCDGKWPLCMPSRRRLEQLGKRKEWWDTQNGGAEMSKIETKIINRLEVLKRDRVKIILVVKYP